MTRPPYRCPVFCTTEVPVTILDALLNVSQEYLASSSDVTERMVLMTSEDILAIPRVINRPVQPFDTPFVGKTPQDIASWYHANIILPNAAGFFKGSFIILDEEALGEQICTVVSMKKGPDNIDILRCEFILGLDMAVILDLDHVFEEVIEKYMRLNILMTKANLKLAMNGGMYLDGMEVKVDEEWKDFRYW